MMIITVLSLTLAAVMSGVAWRLARDERRRSDARVAALGAEIHGDLDLRPTGTPRAAAPAVGTADLFSAAPSASSSASRFAAVIGLGVFVVGTAAALVVVLSGASRERLTSPANPSAAPVASESSRISTDSAQAGSSRTPLELVALGHERDGARLTVRGVVRNPESAFQRDGLTVVVFLFRRDGGFLASGRAAVASRALTAGAESPFVVTIPGVTDVGRYRVSFRIADRVVPHVDRRDRNQTVPAS